MVLKNPGDLLRVLVVAALVYPALVIILRLLYDGHLRARAMRQARVTDSEIRQAARSQGYG
ncbi:hypothetical protein O7634_30440 [Micromonospora sp. WMMD1120]|uniref:hypothetical protein n=1 Tax=Micromonospora sp. WMMD1120 TaxID=3016106 RepID=UPI002416494E|nr:hypothetical protein [Micromonospora sp. WMMD1120]MDG4811099.1 hypothetical protein [Micromonospora sp. WMMD1120]